MDLPDEFSKAVAVRNCLAKLVDVPVYVTLPTVQLPIDAYSLVVLMTKIGDEELVLALANVMCPPVRCRGDDSDDSDDSDDGDAVTTQ